MRWLLRRLRRIALVLGVLLGVVALGLGGLLLALDTESGRRLLAAQVEALLSDDEQTVAIGRLGGDLPGEVVLDGVSIADSEGVWLELDRLRLVWRPLALLDRRIQVEALEVGRVVVARAPESGETRADPLSLPRFRLPFDLEVERLVVASIVLDERVAGDAAELSVAGSLAGAEGGRIGATLQARRLDGTPATADVDLALDPAAGRLRVKVEAREAAGGLLPNLIGVPAQPFSIHLAGEGPLEAWRGRLDAWIGERRFVGLDVAADRRDGWTVAVVGTVDLSRHLPDLGAAPLEVELAAQSADGAAWRIERGRLAAPWARAAVAGSVVLTEAPRFDLAFELTVADDAALPLLPADTRVAGLAATARLSGTPERPAATFRLIAREAGWGPATLRGLALDGVLGGSLEAPSVTLDIAVNDASYEGHVLKGIVGRLAAAGDPAAPEVVFELTAEAAEGEAASGRALAVQGRSTGPLGAPTADLEFTVEAAGFAGVTVRGLSGEAHSAGGLETPRATFRVSAAEVIHGDGALSGLAASGRAEGPFAAPTVTLTATVDAAVQQGHRLDGLELQARLATRNLGAGTLTAEGRAAELRIEGNPVPALAEGPLRFAATAEIDFDAGSVEASSLRLELAKVALEGSGGQDLESGEGSFAGRLTLADLSPLGPLAGLSLKGEGDLDLAVRWQTERRTAEGTFAGRFGKLATGRPEVAALFGAAPGYAGDFILAEDGALSFRRLALDGSAATLTGDAALSADTKRIEAEFQARLADLAVLAPLTGVAASGRARLDGRLSGSLDAPAARLRLEVVEARVEGQALGTLIAELESAGAPEALSGRLRLAASPAPGTLTLETAFRRRGAELALEDLHLRGEGLEVRGDLRLDPAKTLAIGRLAVEARELGPWAALAGLDAAGTLSADVKLAEADGRQSVEATGRLRRFRLAPAGGMPLAGEELLLDLATAWPPAEGSRLKLTGTALRYGEATVASIELDAAGSPSAIEFTVTGEGRYREALSLAAAGRFERTEQAFGRLTLERLTAKGLDTELELERPARLTLLADGAELDGFRARLGGGRIEVAGRADGRGIDLQAAASELALAPLARLGLDATGRVGFEARVEGQWPTPTGSARLSLAEVRLRDGGDVPPVSGKVEAEWRQGRLSVVGSLDAGAGTPLEIEGELALRVQPAPWRVLLPPDEPVSARLAWQGDVARLWSLVPLPEHRLSGRLDADLRVSGSLAAPAVEGELSLAGAEYEHLEFGTLLRDLELRLATEDGRRLKLTQLQASDGGAGRLSGEGAVDLAEAAYNFRLRLRNFHALRRDDITARVDANLGFAGDLRQAKVEGVIKTRHVEAYLANNMSGEVVELDVIEVGGSGAGGAERGTPRRLDVALNLEVQVPGQAYLRGRGLDSEWAGNLAVTGSTGQPRIVGKLRAVRGTFSLIGKTFQLKDSTVQVAMRQGSPDALLDISAVNESSDLEVYVDVTGWASSPEFAWRSVPELPQDEVIARLLFDKGTGQLSPFEAVQLASAVAELSGQGGPPLLDTLRRTIGVDTLRLSGEGESGPKVEAGKYLSERVYVGVQQGAGGDSSGARIELQVLPNISIESEVEATGGANVGARFKWDY